MTIGLCPTKAIVPIREFLLIQIYHLNSITFPETEELQCSIFRCIPAGGPVDASTLSKEQMRSNSQIWRSGSHNAWRTFTEDCADPYIAAYWKSQCRYASLHSTVLQLLCTASSILLLSCLPLWRLSHLWPPLALRRQVRTSNARLDNWPDPSPSIGVSASLFFF